MTVVPHIWQAWARQDLTEIAAVITPGIKTNILAPVVLKTKILKDSTKGLLDVYQPTSSNPQGRPQGWPKHWLYTRAKGELSEDARPLPGEANSILNLQLLSPSSQGHYRTMVLKLTYSLK